MKHKLTALITALALVLVPTAALTSPAYAACGTDSSSKSQVLEGVGNTGGNCDSGPVTQTINAVVNILSLVVGMVSIIMIILSGFRYITSGGDSGKVGNAKNTLIYAIVGLAIAVLAQVIVHFVLAKTNEASLPTCTSDNHLRPPDCVRR